jgi:hypothetical protein
VVYLIYCSTLLRLAVPTVIDLTVLWHSRFFRRSPLLNVGSPPSPILLSSRRRGKDISIPSSPCRLLRAGCTHNTFLSVPPAKDSGCTQPLSLAFLLTRLPIRYCLITIEGKVDVGGNGTLLCTAPSARPSGLQRARALLLIFSVLGGCAQLQIRTFVVIGSIWRCASVH